MSTKAVLLAILVASSSLTQVLSQSAPTETAPPQSDINLTMDDRHVLKENLFKAPGLKRDPAGAKLEQGSVVPDDVELHPFPDEVAKKVSQVNAHKFLLTENAIVIVRAENRKVVEVIKR